MYASVTTAQIQPGKLDEFLQLWRERIVPATQQLKGLKQAFVLTDQETGKGFTIAIYETRAQAEAVQNSGQFRELLTLLGDTLIRETVVRTGYEVSIQVQGPD